MKKQKKIFFRQGLNPSIVSYETKQNKQELSMSKLASIVSATIMDKCQQFIDKVSELRFLKIKERQVNKFNRLLL